MRFLATLAVLVVPALPPVAQPSVEPAEPMAAVELASVEPAEATRSTPRQVLADALEVLHAWDARRARAWADVDPDALRALYVHGSVAGRADVRLLHAYEQRGVVVRRLVTQVFAARLQRRDAGTLRLSVFDRVAGGVVIHEGQTTALRSSRPVTRTITFRALDGSWRVSGVSGSGRVPRAARP